MKAPSIIFIVGNSRSGTTMLGRALGAHAQIHTFPELQVFERLIDKDDMGLTANIDSIRLEILGANILKTIRRGVFVAGSTDDFVIEVQELIQSKHIVTPMELYIELLRHESAAIGKSIPCEQTPRYIFTSNEILNAFSDAHIIHIYRDPRDVLLSQKNRWKRRLLSNNQIPFKRTFISWSNYHPELTSRLWGAVMRQAQSLSDSPRFHEVSYETLLTDPETSLRTLCEKIGIPFDKSIMNVSLEGSSSRRDKDKSVVGFDASRIGNWKVGGLHKAEIEICEKRVGKIMITKGYHLSSIKSNMLARLALQCILPLKIVCAIIFNYSRFRNLGKMISRRFFGI
ncbi:sulfotransferase [Octadecabacter sp.]|nr:sulfotransferase [Octadecabacter sp.]